MPIKPSEINARHDQTFKAGIKGKVELNNHLIRRLLLLAGEHNYSLIA